MAAGKGQRIDAAKIAVRRLAHQALDGIDRVGVCRLPQGCEQGFGFAHDPKLVLGTAFAHHDLLRAIAGPIAPCGRAAKLDPTQEETQ